MINVWVFTALHWSMTTSVYNESHGFSLIAKTLSNTGRRALMLISKPTGQRRSRAFDRSVMTCQREVAPAAWSLTLWGILRLLSLYGIRHRSNFNSVLTGRQIRDRIATIADINLNSLRRLSVTMEFNRSTA